MAHSETGWAIIYGDRFLDPSPTGALLGVFKTQELASTYLGCAEVPEDVDVRLVRVRVEVIDE